jgi:hypothetical protein
MLLRGLVSEAQRGARVLARLERAGASLQVDLDRLAVLRAEDSFRDLVEDFAAGARLGPVVERAERALEEEVPLPGAPRAATDWREMVRPERDRRVGEDRVETPPRPMNVAPAAGTSPARQSVSLLADAGVREQKPGPPAPARPATDPRGEAPAQHAGSVRHERGSGASRPQRQDPRRLEIRERMEAAGLTAAFEAPLLPGEQRVQQPPPPANGGLISQRLLTAVERAERARRIEEIPAALDRERGFAASPRTERESAAITSSPPAAEPRRMPAAIAGSGSGLRRLASLATASTNTAPWPLAPGPAPLPGVGATPYEPPVRAAVSQAGLDFARELADTLRAEAERHGIDTEGLIR